jgi:hypothetical protein
VNKSIAAITQPCGDRSFPSHTIGGLLCVPNGIGQKPLMASG